MSILSSVGAFLNRHRRKLFVSAGILASGYLAIDYLKNKFFEIQERYATERSAKENLRRRFDQNQEDATFTIMALLPTLASDIIDAYPVEHITQQLQQKRSVKAGRSAASDAGISDISVPTKDQEDSNGQQQSQDTAETTPQNQAGLDTSTASVAAQETESGSTVLVDKVPATPATPRASKTQLWQDLKTESIARLFTLVYSTALLVFLTRLQLNILGRKNYVISVVELADSRHSQASSISMVDMTGPDGETFSQDETEEQAVEKEREAAINRMYLMFSWWLLNKGWLSLKEQVNDAVQRVFGPINPRADLTLENLSELIGQVQYLIDYPYDSNAPQNFLSNLIPPQELETYVLTQALSPGESDTLGASTASPSGVFYDSDGNAVEIPAALRPLLDETADLIESPNAGEVIKRLVHTGLSVAVSKISALYPAPPPEPVIQEIVESITQVDEEEIGSVSSSAVLVQEEPIDVLQPPPAVKLASILANVSRQAHAIGAGNPLEPNEYIDAMVNVPDLNAFSAVVYSNFDWRALDN